MAGRYDKSTEFASACLFVAVVFHLRAGLNSCPH